MDELIKLEAQKESLHAEISEYGVKLDEIKELVGEQELRLIEKDGLDDAIDERKEKKSELDKEISDLSSEKNELAVAVNAMELFIEKKDALEKDYKEMSGKFTEMEARYEPLDKEVALLKAQKETLEVHIIEEKDLITALEAEYMDKKEMLSRKFGAVEDAHALRVKETEKEIEDLELEKEELSQSLIESRKEYDSKINMFVTKIRESQEKLDTLDSLYVEKKAEKEVEITNMTAELEKRSSDLDTREGDISLKEATLEDKHRALIAIKTRLEKELGKTININL